MQRSSSVSFFESDVRDHSKDPPGGRAYVGGTRSLRSVVHHSAELTTGLAGYQSVLGIYRTSSLEAGKATANKLLDSLHTCSVSDIARLGRTLRQWRVQILAYFTTGGVNNGAEAIILLSRRSAASRAPSATSSTYRLRVLLTADGSRPY